MVVVCGWVVVVFVWCDCCRCGSCYWFRWICWLISWFGWLLCGWVMYSWWCWMVYLEIGWCCVGRVDSLVGYWWCRIGRMYDRVVVLFVWFCWCFRLIWWCVGNWDWCVVNLVLCWFGWCVYWMELVMIVIVYCRLVWVCLYYLFICFRWWFCVCVVNWYWNCCVKIIVVCRLLIWNGFFW